MKIISFRDDILPLKNMLFRVALRITLDKAEAEAIVQETMIKVWNRRDTWSEIESHRGFLYYHLQELSVGLHTKELPPRRHPPPPICRKTRPTARRLPMRERRKATESSWFIAWSMLFPTSSVCVCSCAILKGKRTRKLLA